MITVSKFHNLNDNLSDQNEMKKTKETKLCSICNLSD